MGFPRGGGASETPLVEGIPLTPAFSPQDRGDRRVVGQGLRAAVPEPDPRRLPVQPHGQLRRAHGRLQTRGGRSPWAVLPSRPVCPGMSPFGESARPQIESTIYAYVREGWLESAGIPKTKLLGNSFQRGWVVN